MIAVNVLFVPGYGYRACAWGGFAGYGTAMVLSWAIGRRRYPVPYDGRTIAKYVIMAVLLYALSALPGRLSDNVPVALTLVFNTLLLAVYCLPLARRLMGNRIKKQ